MNAVRFRLCLKHRDMILKRRINTPASKSTKKNDEAYCLNLVKQKDWEGFICTLLLPKSSRRSAFALRAFNTELSQVGESVSEASIGHMRLHFWKSCLDLIYDDKPPESPVASELHRAVASHRLPKFWLKRMIEARENYIDGRGFRNIRELEDYADDTSTAQLCLLLQCLGFEDTQCDHVASHVGKSHGIVTVIRSTPYHAVRRKVQLPMEFLAKHSVSQEEIVRGSEEQKVKDLIFDLASQAHVHLQHARDVAVAIPSEAKSAFLNTASIDWYLKNLNLADFNVFHPKLQQRNSKLPFSVLLNRFLRRV